MRIATLVLFLPLTACYAYVPVEDTPPPSGARVRVHIEETAREELRGEIGPQAAMAQGTVLEWDGEAITLAVDLVRTEAGVANPWNRERVALPASAVARMEGRTLSMTRSALFAGGFVVAGVLFRNWVGSSGWLGGSDGRAGEPGPTDPNVQ